MYTSYSLDLISNKNYNMSIVYDESESNNSSEYDSCDSDEQDSVPMTRLNSHHQPTVESHDSFTFGNAKVSELNESKKSSSSKSTSGPKGKLRDSNKPKHSVKGFHGTKIDGSSRRKNSSKPKKHSISHHVDHSHDYGFLPPLEQECKRCRVLEKQIRTLQMENKRLKYNQFKSEESRRREQLEQCSSFKDKQLNYLLAERKRKHEKKLEKKRLEAYNQRLDNDLERHRRISYNVQEDADILESMNRRRLKYHHQ